MRDVTPLLIDVQSDLDRELGLESLARRCGYSPFHFHRLFRKAVGETSKRHVDIRGASGGPDDGHDLGPEVGHVLQVHRAPEARRR
jgi:AraC-like DNA-binding protein